MSRTFNTIGLIGKYDAPNMGGTLQELIDLLKRRSLRILLDEATGRQLGDHDLETASRDRIGQECDLAIVVGGDGSLLNAARSLSQYDVPLLGVNLGRLGFLVDVSPAEMAETIEQVLNGQYNEEQRFLLATTVERQGEHLSENDAFNDVSIHKSHVARMIELEAYIDNAFVATLRADGLIVSSPTGSTAYALSAGGPIIHPSLNAIVIVPVCPHTLSNRPLVINGDCEVEIVVKDAGQSEVLVTCDGQISLGLGRGDRLTIRKKPHPITLIHPLSHDYYDILRKKLHWGEKLT